MPVLLRVTTASWQLDIAGPVKGPPPFLQLPLAPLRCTATIALQAYNRESGDLKQIDSGQPFEAILFENTEYDFYFERFGTSNADIRLPAAASLRYSHGSLLHYSINFGNDVGKTDVLIGARPALTRLTLDVFPLKVDFETDYVRMRDDVASICRSLAMNVYSRTYASATPATCSNPTLAEWLSLIRHFFDRLLATAHAIAANPHSSLTILREDVPLHKSRKVDERLLERRLRRTVHRPALELGPSGPTLPEHVPERRNRTTFDNPENRYAKYLLFETVRRLQQIGRAESTGDEDAELSAEQRFFAAIRPEAREMARQLRQVLLAPFLRGVQAEVPAHRFSAVFTSHPHYAALVRMARLLNAGLNFGGGPLSIGVKHIALLYEYWCFLQLVRILSERFSLEQQNLVRLRHLGMVVVLAKGRESAVRYKDTVTGKPVVLLYNRMFAHLPTVTQRPDNVIQLATEERLYILDAKYRISYDEDYLSRYLAPGPNVDDINTMHRYRDAIVIPSPLTGDYRRGLVQSAVVLFPLPDEDGYTQHRFYRSIAQVQIGGLPFLPGATRLTYQHVQFLLAAEGYGPLKSEAS